MLLGDIPIRKLKDLSVKFWNAPLDTIKPCYVDVEVVGMIESCHTISVSFIVNVRDEAAC
jgi:hypothetical protein